ncbi:MAG: 5'/3'-nucleotidase SurE [Coxiellaceae bacterium]|mgnify:CR=1 FL=1|nr:5'/3'-nucleotidase SurE [Coxiellaceae bacterium]
MKILLSNDDGVFAEGIHALADALRPIADITIVAPDRNRSGASNSLSLHRPIRAKTLESGIISVEGTPTDCVHLAVTGLLKEQPDMIISGINDGANLADDVWYSGTVAAAMEGAFLGLPSIAVSLDGSNCSHFKTAASVVRSLVELTKVSPLSSNRTFFNVNVPDIAECDLQGIEVTRLGKRHSAQPTIEQKDPRGKTIYWVGPIGEASDAQVGTDFHAVKDNKVSLTPMKIDMTDYDVQTRVSDWLGVLGTECFEKGM